MRLRIKCYSSRNFLYSFGASFTMHVFISPPVQTSQGMNFGIDLRHTGDNFKELNMFNIGYTFWNIKDVCQTFRLKDIIFYIREEGICADKI